MHNPVRSKHNGFTPTITSKTKCRFILAAIICLFLAFVSSTLVFADNPSVVETTFFGNLQDDDKGCGVYTILNQVIDIMSMGIGIVGVIGITIVGIQYLTAGGNEQQTIKAKRRMLEIIIGIIAYVLLYAATQWLLPGGKLNTTPCQTVTDSELAAIRAREQAAREARQAARNEAIKNNSNSSSTKRRVSGSGLTLSAQIAKTYTPEKMAKLINQGKVAPLPVCTDCSWSERIAQTAELLAWSKSTSSKVKNHNYSFYPGFKNWGDLGTARPTNNFIKAIDKVWPKHGFSSVTGLGADCGTFVNVVLAYSGHDTRKAKSGAIRNKYYSYFGSNSQKKHWQKVNTAKRGDVCFTKGGKFHTLIYLGNNRIAEAGHFSKRFGQIKKGGCGSNYYIYRAL